MMWRVAICVGFLGLVVGARPSLAADGLVTFDTVPAGSFPRGGTYTESGMQATSFSDFSSLSDPLGAGTGGNWLYFHGTNQYIEFRQVDGAVFDLASLDLVTNGQGNTRWATASSGATQTLPGVASQTVVLGPGFQNITWFRIVTAGGATQVDNIRFRVFGGPYAVLPNRGGDSGPTTVSVNLVDGFANPSTVKLQRVGQTDIVGVNTTVDGSGAMLTSTFDLTGAAIGYWDIVVETGGTTLIFASAFLVEGAFRVTFDTALAGPLPRGGTYIESGMQATSFSDFSSLSDPLGAGTGGNWLYFHGTNQYIEFRQVDGAVFDLASLDLVTNGQGNTRWATASSGATQTLPGVASQTVVLGPGFQNITWFRIVTAGGATQVDNIRFRVFGGPYAVLPNRGGDSGPTTVQVNLVNGFTDPSTAKLRRAGQADIVGVNTTVDGSGAMLTSTFDLTGAAIGYWDIVVETGGTTLVFASAFLVEGAFRVTFDTALAGPLPRGSTYTESGMRVTSFSDFSSLGDTLGASFGGNWLYFHGTDQYIEFRLVNGAVFDLISFDLVTNGGSRWVTSSSGATQYFEEGLAILGPGFQNVTWVRIGTAGGATQFDNVRFAPVSSLGIWPNRGGDSGTVTATLRGGVFSPASTVTLRRAGEADIVALTTTADASGAALTATFDLTGRARGEWDVVVETGGSTLTLADGFTIEEGRPVAPWVDVIGRATFRPGRPSTIFLEVGNRGNTDARGIPVVVTDIPLGTQVRPKFSVVPPPVIPGAPTPIVEEPIVDQLDDQLALAVMLSKLPPGEVMILPIELTPPPGAGAFAVSVRVGPPFLSSSDAAAAASFSSRQAESASQPTAQCIYALLSYVPVVGCLEGVFAIEGHLLGPEPEVWTVWDWINNTAGACGGRLLKNEMSLKPLHDWIETGTTTAIVVKECGPWNLPRIPAKLAMRPVQSADPNDKVGSSGGGGPFFYISGQEPLRYAVYFENLEAATASAQEIVITDQLDPATVDLSTLRFGAISFGSTVVDLANDGQSSVTIVDLRPENDLLVRVSVSIDEVTGLIEWRFGSLDPATGLPTEDPLAGFLPPNVNPPEGDGSVVFTVAPRAGLPTGTQITNQASIVFDTNAPILTPVWLNTINQPRCGTTPDTGCRHAGTDGSSLKLRDHEDTTKDSFAWKWNKGDLTELVDFRDPVHGFNDYRICIYDSSANNQPLMEAEVFPGENCGSKTCWKAAGKTGLKFKSKGGVPNGITGVGLKAGPTGKAKLEVKGKGSNLELPTLPLTGPVTVQFLVNDGRSRECWETTYATPSKNETGKFEAKGP